MAEDRLRTLGLVGLGLVHELNSPLTSTALSLELLLDQLDSGADPSAVRAQVAENLARVQRMAGLVHRFRALARGESQATQCVALDHVADRAARLARATLGEVGGEVTIRTQAAPAPPVQADALLLEHAVLCLVLNAADVGQTVEIVVEPGAVHVDDDGPGIPDPEKALQLGYSEKGGRGMGVGLALVQLIAADAGAQLTVAQSPQGGARVSLRFS